MKHHLQSTSALALMTVAALVGTAWTSLAVADDPVGTIWALSEQGSKFEVFRTQNNRPEHQGALIYVVQTRKGSPNNPNVKNGHGLAFVQSNEEVHGQGFICGLTAPKANDRSLECHQNIGNSKETLTIGAIGSTFCDDLRQEIETCVEENPANRNDLYTSEDKNPVVTQAECEEEYGDQGKCVCFEISLDNRPVCQGPGPAGPPNSGSGSGGHP